MLARNAFLVFAFMATTLRLEAACTNPTFTQADSLETGHAADQVTAFAAGDVDRDGKVDVAVPSWATDDVRVFLGNGDATFDAYASYPATDPSEILIADLNGDDWPDIAVLYATSKVGVLLNQGNGTFAAVQGYEHALHLASSIEAADFNGDGRPELLVTDLGPFTSSPDMRILWNDGSGGFATRNEWFVNGNAANAVSADFNADGLSDIALVYGPYSGNEGHLAIYVRGPNGIPASATHDYTIPPLIQGGNTASMMDIVIAHFNGDTDPDIGISYFTGFTAYIGGVGGAFTKGGAFEQSPGGDFVALDADDLNEDGNTDVVFASLNGDAVWFLTGNGNGNFAQQPSLISRTYGHTFDTIIADVNNDVRPDVLHIDSAGEVTLFMNECPARFVTVAISSSANPSTYPNNVTITVTVTPRGGTLMPSGNVSLTDNNVAIGTQPLTQNASNSTATFTLTKPALGTYTLRATYLGDSTFGTRQSSPFNQVVERPPFGTPLDVRATRSGSNIEISWIGTTGATGYEVFRMSGGVWQSLTTTGSEVFLDTSVPNTTPQLYTVRSLMTGSSPSAMAVPDVANTFIYSSTLPILGVVRATDVNELRTLIDGLRSNAGLPGFAWTDPSLAGATIKAVHQTDLRTALGQAFSAVGIAQPSYTQTMTAGVTIVKRVDLIDLRNALE